MRQLSSATAALGVGRAGVAAVLVMLAAGCGASGRDAASNAPVVVAKIETGKMIGSAAGLGGLWLSLHREGVVALLDPARNAIAATIPVGPSPDGPAIGLGAVWVPVEGRGLVRIDPRRKRVVGVTRGVYWEVATGAGAVWALQWIGAPPGWFEWLGRTIARIDPRSGRVVARIDLDGRLASIAVGEGSVWVANDVKREIDRIDPDTNRVIARIALPAEPDHVTVGEGAVWATFRPGRLARIDPVSNRVVARIKTGSDAQYLDAGEGSVWVGNVNHITDSTLARVDPATNRVTATTPVGDGPQSVSVGFGDVWVGSFEEGRVWRLRPYGLRP